MWVKKQQFESYMEQLTGSKLGKENDKVVYYYPSYLTYMQSTSCEMLGWMADKLESRLLENIKIRYVGDSTLMAESKEKLRAFS